MAITRGPWPVGPFVRGYYWFENLSARRRIVLPITFLIIYLPFLFLNGWKYIGNPSQDFRSFYGAAQVVFTHGRSPYDPEALGQVVGSFGNHRFFPYVYPPWSTLFFFPLTKMSYAHACNVVLVINNLLYLVLLWLVPVSLLGFDPRKRPAAFILSVIVMVLFDPVRWSLFLGQVDILVLTSLVLFWVFSRSGRVLPAGIFLAFAIYLKTYPVIFVPFLLLAGRWRECLRAFVWIGLAVLVSYIALPHLLWHDWLVKVVPSGGYFSTPAGLYPSVDIRNESLNGFFARLFKVGNGLHGNPTVLLLEKLAAYSSVAFLVAATGLAVWRGRKSRDVLDRCFIVTLPLVFLIAPFSFRQHMIYLLPSILFLIFSHGQPGRKRDILFYSLFAVTAVVIASPRTLPLEFYAVFILWALATFALLSNKFEFAKSKVPEPESGEQRTTGLSAAR